MNIFKKVTTVILCILLSFTLVSCTKDQSSLEWPNAKPITLLCGMSAGGSTDLMCRILADALKEELGQEVIVKNMTGGGGFTAWNEVYKNVAPDGYTFTTVNPGLVVGKHDATNRRDIDCFDFQLLANHVVDYNVIAWRPDESRWDNLVSFIEYAQENEVLFGASNVGIQSDDIAVAKLLERQFATKMTSVFTDGSKEDETLLLNGSTDIMIANVGDVLNSMKEGNIVVGAIFAPDRSALIPEIPTCKELTNYELINFSARGYCFPKGVDEEIVEKMTQALTHVINSERVITELATIGCETKCYAGNDYSVFLSDFLARICDLFDL